MTAARQDGLPGMRRVLRSPLGPTLRGQVEADRGRLPPRSIKVTWRSDGTGRLLGWHLLEPSKWSVRAHFLGKGNSLTAADRASSQGAPLRLISTARESRWHTTVFVFEVNRLVPAQYRIWDWREAFGPKWWTSLNISGVKPSCVASSMTRSVVFGLSKSPVPASRRDSSVKYGEEP